MAKMPDFNPAQSAHADRAATATDMSTAYSMQQHVDVNEQTTHTHAHTFTKQHGTCAYADVSYAKQSASCSCTRECLRLTVVGGATRCTGWRRRSSAAPQLRISQPVQAARPPRLLTRRRSSSSAGTRSPLGGQLCLNVLARVVGRSEFAPHTAQSGGGNRWRQQRARARACGDSTVFRIMSPSSATRLRQVRGFCVVAALRTTAINA